MCTRLAEQVSTIKHDKVIACLTILCVCNSKREPRGVLLWLIT